MPDTKYLGGQSPYTYSYDNRTGWRRFRMLNPCRGMYHDVRRRLPYYWSDIRDALTYRTIASTIRIYFINILPAIAYTLDMYRRTGEFYGINEALFSSALAAMVFSVLGAQPLTIVGITGLISLFNYTIYDIIVIYEPAIYANFMCWTAIWAAIFHWIVAVCNLCDYMSYVTDFSSESFGAYVGIIYCIKGVEELVNEFTVYGPTAGFMSCMIAILYFFTIYSLELVGSSTICRPWLRELLADYAYVIGTIFWVGFAHIPGNLKATGISFVPITRSFYPTQPRGWLVHFWELETKWVFAALPFGFLVMLLFYYDHNVSSLGAQGRQYPLKKPAGFHWDFFLLGCTTFIAGITGIPMPNGLVPQVQPPTSKQTNSILTYPPIQAPVHTTSLTVTETTLHIIPISDPESEGTEIRHPIITATAVVEQRISHFLMGLAIIGTMTGPLLIVLHTMPAAVFAGVFFIVGWGSIESNGILHKIIFLLREDRFIPRNEKLLRVPKRKIVLYVMCQVIGVAACVAISQTIAAIGFPILIIGLIPFRVWVVPRWFGVEELGVLDGLTADGEAVLCSLGGPPRFPGEVRRVEGERQKGGE
ncbi:putative transporter C543.05c [Aspergillus awamori]|uniref:Putative transporter C543.05c n=1 Tax=Aspergillus awamori TaxID=105351 RepID=A0A401L5Y9_ASPAW|nr:putative transporter C543.05c [Aspergillus awamori]